MALRRDESVSVARPPLRSARGADRHTARSGARRAPAVAVSHHRHRPGHAAGPIRANETANVAPGNAVTLGLNRECLRNEPGSLPENGLEALTALAQGQSAEIGTIEPEKVERHIGGLPRASEEVLERGTRLRQRGSRKPRRRGRRRHDGPRSIKGRPAPLIRLKRCERRGSSPRCSRAAAHRPERSGPQRQNAHEPCRPRPNRSI